MNTLLCDCLEQRNKVSILIHKVANVYFVFYDAIELMDAKINIGGKTVYQG